MIPAELILDSKAILGEGPIWDNGNKLLYWIDILSCSLYVFHPVTGENRRIELPNKPGTVVAREKGGVLLALDNGFYFCDLKSEKLEFICDPESQKPDNRFNDGKCDPSGRFWAGTMKKDELGPAMPVGSLYRMDTDLSVHKMLDKVSISNGIVWSSDKATMYYIDSPLRKVWAYDYDDEAGTISNGRAVIDGSEETGMFDGMTIDQNDNLWIAHFGGFKLSCWNPRSSRKLDEVCLPCPNVTACAFGGENKEELYITTARLNLTKEEIELYPLSGGLFKTKPGVKGVISSKFKG